MSQLAVWCFESSSLVKLLSHLKDVGRRSVARTHASFERGGQPGVGPIAGEKKITQAGSNAGPAGNLGRGLRECRPLLLDDPPSRGRCVGQVQRNANLRP